MFNKKSYELKITVQTGLHIGVGNDKMQIGGVDSAVIKDPSSKLPYIPGSSIKGKIRCLLETEKYTDGELNEFINTCFGINNEYKKKMEKEEKKDYETPTRIIFRDLKLDEESMKKFKSGKITTEFKTEIVIDRRKGTAKDGGLRTIERIPPDTVFEGKLLIRYKDNEELKKIEKLLEEGIELLKTDYLGGSGSRGYGAVSIELKQK